MIERVKSAMVGAGAGWVLWLMLALSVVLGGAVYSGSDVRTVYGGAVSGAGTVLYASRNGAA